MTDAPIQPLKRVLLKLSGEVLGGGAFCRKAAVEDGRHRPGWSSRWAEGSAIVVGGGNLSAWRRAAWMDGRQLHGNVHRDDVPLQDYLEKEGNETRAVRHPTTQVRAGPRARDALPRRACVVIFGARAGMPF